MNAIRRVLLPILLVVAAAAGVSLPQRAEAARPVVTVVIVDQTNGTWPGIHEAADGWGTSKRIDVVYRSSCVNRKLRYCIVVTAKDMGKIDRYGQAVKTGYTSARVELNTAYAYDYANHALLMERVVCHEIGHALGIGHADAAGAVGCIAAKETDHANMTPTPSSADLAQLRAAFKGSGMHGPAQGWGAAYIV